MADEDQEEAVIEDHLDERARRRPREEGKRFYTDVLGFVKKRDIPLGEARWLTVVSPDDPEGTELLLEPDEHPAARPFKEALVSDGIPFSSFAVEDVNAEFDRLRSLGVRFTQEPAKWARQRPRSSRTRAATSSRSRRCPDESNEREHLVDEPNEGTKAVWEHPVDVYAMDAFLSRSRDDATRRSDR